DVIVVDVCEAGLRLTQTHLLAIRDDLLLCEALELLPCLPHIDHPEPVTRRRCPVEERASEMRAPSRAGTHRLNDRVVLLRRRSAEILLDRDCYYVLLQSGVHPA